MPLTCRGAGPLPAVSPSYDGGSAPEQLEHEVTQDLVAVLGEDRLGVELDTAEVGTGDEMHVAGPFVCLPLVCQHADAFGEYGARPGHEGVVEPDHLVVA